MRSAPFERQRNDRALHRAGLDEPEIAHALEQPRIERQRRERNRRRIAVEWRRAPERDLSRVVRTFDVRRADVRTTNGDRSWVVARWCFRSVVLEFKLSFG